MCQYDFDTKKVLYIFYEKKNLYNVDILKKFLRDQALNKKHITEKEMILNF